MDSRDRMVSLGHKRYITVFDHDGLIERAIIGVNALHGEALWRVQAMIVGFLKQGLIGQVVGVVFVRWIRRGVSGRGDDLDDQQ